MADIFDLSGQTAVVVGASSGLGAGFAKILARAGANLAILARRLNRLESLAREINEIHKIKCIVISCDIASEKEIVRAVEVIMENFQNVHILINNAAILRISKSVHQTRKMFDEVMNVNVRGMFLMSREIGKHMIKNRYGRIINISSIGSIRSGIYHITPYNASKAAVNGLTRALAVEWGRYNITVNAILPGLIETEMSMSMGIPGGNRPEMIERARRKGEAWMDKICPLRRMGQLSDFEGVTLLLASAASTYITGQTLIVDGGLTIALSDGGVDVPG